MVYSRSSASAGLNAVYLRHGLRFSPNLITPALHKILPPLPGTNRIKGLVIFGCFVPERGLYEPFPSAYCYLNMIFLGIPHLGELALEVLR